MSVSEYLAALSRLVSLLSMPAAIHEDRRALVLQLAELAADEALVVHLPREGAPTVGGGSQLAHADLSVDAWALVEVLRLHHVRRLVVRRGAATRELAQFAGLLVREGAATEAAAPVPGGGADAPLQRGLNALAIWSVQLDFHGPEGGLLVGVPDAVRDAVEAACAARTPAGIAAAYEAVGRALGEARAAAASESEAAAQVARVLTHLVGEERRHARRLGADEVAAHRQGLDRVLAPELGAVVDAVVEGTVPEAWQAVRLAADRAVPLLVNRLGDAESIDERRRCFNALLDAGGGTDALLEGLRDPRWYVVRNVALVLGELREPGAVRLLARALQEPDERVREAAAQALARIDGPAATHALVAALRDAHTPVRRIAARAARVARQHRVAVNVPLVATRLRAERDLDVAQDLVEALCEQHTGEALAALAALVAAPNESALGQPLASAAAAALRQLPAVRVSAHPRGPSRADPALA